MVVLFLSPHPAWLLSWALLLSSLVLLLPLLRWRRRLGDRPVSFEWTSVLWNPSPLDGKSLLRK